MGLRISLLLICVIVNEKLQVGRKRLIREIAESTSSPLCVGLLKF